MTTLTVDDNPMIVQAVQEILTRIASDGTHLSALTGADALKKARQAPPDVAFLDIEMPDVSGLELAERLKSLRERTNIVFITGHEEYAISAFDLYASGYLLKPVTERQLRRALDNLRYPVSSSQESVPKRLKVRCFGQFEVWCGGEVVRFRRSRSKELFAYLVDRRGSMCSTQQLVSALWPDVPEETSYASQLRVFIAELQTTLTQLGHGEALVRGRGMLGVRPSAMDCDYYDYLAGSPAAVQNFFGEYMSQYSFGEPTLAELISKRYENTGD